MKKLTVIIILILLASSVFAQSNGSIFGDSLPYVEQSLHIANGWASIIGIIICSVGMTFSYSDTGPAYDGPPDFFFYSAGAGFLTFNAIHSFSMAFSDYGAKKYAARRSSDPKAFDSYRTVIRFPNFDIPATLDPDFYIDLPLLTFDE